MRRRALRVRGSVRAGTDPVTCGLTHEERHDALRARYGPIRQADAGMALRLAGLREKVHPLDVIAYLYQSREAAEAYAESNQEHYGHSSLAVIPCDTGVTGIIDLRPFMRREGMCVMFPGLPDKARGRLRQ